MILRLILMLSVNLQPVEVESFLQSRGMRVQVQMVRLGDPLVYNTQLDYFNRLNAAFNFTGKRMILTNPFLNGKQEFLLGYADYKGKIAHCVFNETNERGESRRLHSLLCIAHELAHLCKLPHTQGCISITDEAVMSCPNIATIGFLPDELKKLNRCK